jgi:hypothetical protein
MNKKPPFRFQTPLEEAIAQALNPKAPPAASGLLDAPWVAEMRHQCDVDPEYRKHVETLRDQHQADPIFTPLFVSILGAGGFGLTGAVLSTAVMIASAIATTSVVAGVQTR